MNAPQCLTFARDGWWWRHAWRSGRRAR